MLQTLQRKGLPGFHLAENNCRVLLCYNIDLSPSHSEVSLENSVPLAYEVLNCTFLALSSFLMGIAAS